MTALATTLAAKLAIGGASIMVIAAGAAWALQIAAKEVKLRKQLKRKIADAIDSTTAAITTITQAKPGPGTLQGNPTERDRLVTLIAEHEETTVNGAIAYVKALTDLSARVAPTWPAVMSLVTAGIFLLLIAAIAIVTIVT